MNAILRAPFPWFGGKRRVADVVWRAFGPSIANYVEPFAGSLAVLLARPNGAGKIETVNDRDRYLANFWRAVMADPDAVAASADWPVNEADLHARHKWLVNQAEFRERMHTDPDFYDVKIAGWWVWGICQWIGGGWCVEPKATGQRSEAEDRKRPEMDGTAPGRGVHSDGAHEAKPPSEWVQLPDLSTFKKGGGRGIHSEANTRKLPSLAVGGANGDAAGRGMLSEAAVASQSRCASGWNERLYLARRHGLTNDHGVHLPSLGNDRGLNGVIAPPCVDWFRALQIRLRRVRVACGDWTRVLGDSVLGKGKNVGGRRPCAVFLDPPYSHEFRDPYLYSEDDASISAKVREWALERGDDPDLRIALCGYSGEHEMPPTWTEHAWKASRGYAGEGNDNRERERIWFSPHCLPIETQRSLFSEVAT